MSIHDWSYEQCLRMWAALYGRPKVGDLGTGEWLIRRDREKEEPIGLSDPTLDEEDNDEGQAAQGSQHH